MKLHSTFRESLAVHELHKVSVTFSLYELGITASALEIPPPQKKKEKEIDITIL